MKTTLLRIPEDLYVKISQLEEEQKRSTNSQIVFILDEYMKQKEENHSDNENK